MTALTQPTPKLLMEEIDKCKSLTDKPFAVNLTVGVVATEINYDEYIEVICRSGVKIVETAGRSPEPFMERFNDAGIKVIHKCVAVRHALKAERIGVAAVSIDGFECAGHPGEEDVTGLVLIPAAAKQSIDEIILEMSSPLPSLRISLFTYRDFGDNYVYYGTPLTFDLEHLPGFLQSFIHGQGGDIPEAVHETVKAAAKKLNWRKDAHKVIIFAGDAPHHPELDKEFRYDIKKWATKENRGVLHAIFTDTNRRSMDIGRRKKREDPEAFEHPYFDIYRSIAKEGRGRAVLLSDESALIKEILVLAFGPVWRADIENLLDFRN